MTIPKSPAAQLLEGGLPLMALAIVDLARYRDYIDLEAWLDRLRGSAELPAAGVRIVRRTRPEIEIHDDEPHPRGFGVIAEEATSGFSPVAMSDAWQRALQILSDAGEDVPALLAAGAANIERCARQVFPARDQGSPVEDNRDPTPRACSEGADTPDNPQGRPVGNVANPQCDTQSAPGASRVAHPGSEPESSKVPRCNQCGQTFDICDDPNCCRFVALRRPAIYAHEMGAAVAELQSELATERAANAEACEELRSIRELCAASACTQPADCADSTLAMVEELRQRSVCIEDHNALRSEIEQAKAASAELRVELTTAQEQLEMAHVARDQARASAEQAKARVLELEADRDSWRRICESERVEFGLERDTLQSRLTESESKLAAEIADSKVTRENLEGKLVKMEADRAWAMGERARLLAERGVAIPAVAASESDVT